MTDAIKAKAEPFDIGKWRRACDRARDPSQPTHGSVPVMLPADLLALHAQLVAFRQWLEYCRNEGLDREGTLRVFDVLEAFDARVSLDAREGE